MEILVHILQALFFAGFVGCAITIPICAWKYFAVLFEPDSEEEMRANEQAAD